MKITKTDRNESMHMKMHQKHWPNIQPERVNKIEETDAVIFSKTSAIKEPTTSNASQHCNQVFSFCVHTLSLDKTECVQANSSMSHNVVMVTWLHSILRSGPPNLHTVSS